MTTKVFNYSVKLYEYLDLNGREATEGKVWEGSLKDAASQIELPDGYYQRCRTLLGDLECIRYIRTGHGKTLSIIHLTKIPTVELYNEYRNTSKGKRSTRTNEVVSSRLTDMANRIAQLERDMISMAGIVRSQSKRISDLESGGKQ